MVYKIIIGSVFLITPHVKDPWVYIINNVYICHTNCIGWGSAKRVTLLKQISTASRPRNIAFNCWVTENVRMPSSNIYKDSFDPARTWGGTHYRVLYVLSYVYTVWGRVSYPLMHDHFVCQIIQYTGRSNGGRQRSCAGGTVSWFHTAWNTPVCVVFCLIKYIYIRLYGHLPPIEGCVYTCRTQAHKRWMINWPYRGHLLLSIINQQFPELDLVQWRIIMSSSCMHDIRM